MPDQLGFEGVEVVTPLSEAEWAAYYQLRWEMLRAPWDQPLGSERDEHESESNHRMIRLADKTLVAVGRAHVIDTTIWQIRYMAVSKDYQRCGFGRRLLHQLEADIRMQKGSEIRLNARESAHAFYSSMGYETMGESHTLYGEIPHVAMRKLV